MRIVIIVLLILLAPSVPAIDPERVWPPADYTVRDLSYSEKYYLVPWKIRNRKLLDKQE